MVTLTIWCLVTEKNKTEKYIWHMAFDNICVYAVNPIIIIAMTRE